MTSFGQYSFSKHQPWMSFSYRDGTPLISHSVFYVNSTFQAPIILSDYSVDMTYLDTHHFRYSVNLRSAGSQLGALQVSFVFDKIQRPKITISVNPSLTLTDNGFNVVWIVRSLNTFARFKEAWVDFSNYTDVALASWDETHFELGPDEHPESWRLSALVDWSDSFLKAKIVFRKLSQFQFLSGPVAVVTFPGNLSAIDPTIVGQSSVAYGSAQSFQRHAFFDGANYWAFYYDGSGTVYEYSGDGRTWNNSPSVLWAYPYTAIWYNSGTVYALAGSSSSGSPPVSATLSFRKGMISGTSIVWSSIVTVDSYTYDPGSPYYYAWLSYQDVNLIVGSDGLVTVAYTLFTERKYKVCEAPPLPAISPGAACDYREGSGWVYYYEGSRSLLVRKSNDVNDASWSASTTIASDSSYSKRYLPILSPLANGVVLGIYEDNANGAIKYSLSTAWTTTAQLDTGPSGIVQFGSAVSSSANVVNFVYVCSDNTIRYRSYNGTWSGPITIASAMSTSPTISLGDGNDLHVQYVNSNVVYVVSYSSFSGWGSPSTPLGTSFNSPAYLSSGANSTSGFLVSLWTEGTAAPYSIKLGSLPIEQVWSPYSVPSDPWDQEGLIPYGHYFKNLQEYVSPSTGLLTIVQTDFALPGRGFSSVFTCVPYSLHFLG